MLFHDDAIAAGVKLNMVHKAAHQHDTAAARDFEPVFALAIRHGARVEPLALVFDGDPQVVRRDAAGDLDGLRRSN